MLLGKYNFNKDIEIYSNNSCLNITLIKTQKFILIAPTIVDSDEEYYDGKCIDLFLEIIRKK